MWSPQRYLAEGIKLGIDIKILQSAVRQIQRLRSHNPPLPPLLSLSHLATTIESDTAYLDRVITRSETAYRGFSIRKRSGGLRDIYVPSSALMTTQRWIAQNILCELPVHSASQAFKKGNSIVNCAQVHCEAKWLIKLDIANFFGSISEPQIYKVFQRLGYNNLVSFQLTRLCTWPDFTAYRKYAGTNFWHGRNKKFSISRYTCEYVGALPQGAATSPLLSNLVMCDLDKALTQIAAEYGLQFTRYSDDMTFSTVDDNFTREKAGELIKMVAAVLKVKGLYLNKKKTNVVPPGARKVVLGLLVDRVVPALPREFKDKLRQHLYYLKKHGVENHIERRKFDSAGGAYRHILGLINFANMVDAEFAEKMKAELNSLPWLGVAP